MDFSENTVALTREQVLAGLYHNPLTPSDMKKLFESYKDTPIPVDMPSFSILSRRYHSMAHDREQKKEHLTKKLERIFDTRDVTVTPTSLVYKDEKTVQLAHRRGYFVEDVKSVEPILCYIADALAYMYTPPTEIRGMSIANNFANDPKGVGLPVLTETMPYSDGWKGSYAQENSELQYNRLDLSRAYPAAEFLQRVYAPLSQVQSPQTLFVQATNNQNKVLPVPFRPSVIESSDFDKAWRFLGIHRGVRSEDGKWLSPMTSGYYFGGLTRPLANVFYQVADILHVLRIHGLGAVVFDFRPHQGVSMSLAVNGIVVLVPNNVYDTTAIALRPDKTLQPGVYPYYTGDVIPLAREHYLRVMSFPDSRPVVKKNSVDYPDSSLRCVERMLNCLGLSMAWLSLQPKLQEINMQYFPSVHAHAGHVLAVSGTKIPSQYSLKQLLNRMTVANGFKTWFPISRTRFLEFDATRYKFENQGIANSMIMRLRAEKTSKFLDFGPVMDVSDLEVDLTIPVFTTLLFSNAVPIKVVPVVPPPVKMLASAVAAVPPPPPLVPPVIPDPPPVEEEAAEVFGEGVFDY